MAGLAGGTIEILVAKCNRSFYNIFRAKYMEMGSWFKPAERKLYRFDPQPDLDNANVGMKNE